MLPQAAVLLIIMSLVKLLITLTDPIKRHELNTSYYVVQ